MTPDIINGAFELTGGLLYVINIARVLKDKKVAGVSWIPTLFFTFWGAWNLYYYPFLNQPYSFYGGLLLMSSNAVWVALSIYYSRKIQLQ